MLFCVCVCVHVEGRSVTAQVRRSEDNFWESVLSSHHVGPRDQTQVITFGSKHLSYWVTSLSPTPLLLKNGLTSKCSLSSPWVCQKIEDGLSMKLSRVFGEHAGSPGFDHQHKHSTVALTCNPSTREEKAGRSEI